MCHAKVCATSEKAKAINSMDVGLNYMHVKSIGNGRSEHGKECFIVIRY